MKWLITVLTCLFISLTCFAQLPDSVKQIEIVSEVQDTMILINKADADIINTMFHRYDAIDSLNVVNEEFIRTLNAVNTQLENTISEQRFVINNQEIQIKHIREQNKEVISDLEKQLKRANGWKVFWESTTGLGVVAIILLAIF